MIINKMGWSPIILIWSSCGFGINIVLATEIIWAASLLFSISWNKLYELRNIYTLKILLCLKLPSAHLSSAWVVIWLDIDFWIVVALIKLLISTPILIFYIFPEMYPF